MSITPLWSDESQLIGYGESDSGGPWIKLRVPDLEAFRGRKGEVLHATLIEMAQIEQEPKQPERRRERSLAERMHNNGYFLNRKLWHAMDEKGIYTQAMHKCHVESLPCYRPESYVNGKPLACLGDVVLHHVRTAENSGTGVKPEHWYGLPLCHAHHDWVHKFATREQRQQYLGEAAEITAGRMKVAMKHELDIESLSGITQEQVSEFEREVYA